MARWIKEIIAVSILAFLVWYLVGHWNDLKVLLKLRPIDLLILYALGAVGVINNSCINQRLLNTLGVKISFGNIFALQSTTRLLNLAPMKLGTIFRGNFLKRHFGLALTHYAVFFMYYTLMMVAIAGMIGFIALISGYSLENYQSRILAAVFLGMFFASVAVLFLPLPEPKGSSRPSRLLRSFLQGRKTVSKNKKVIFACAIHLLITFLLLSVRMYFIYSIIDQVLPAAGYVILATLGFASLIISFTPGALGVREVVMAAGAIILGIPAEVGIFAAMFDRSIMLGWTFVVGGISTVWLWKKNPSDFKSDKQNDNCTA